MFGLLYGLFEYWFKYPEYHVLMVGVDRAGKTTLLERLKAVHTGQPGLQPSKVLPTVGLNMGRVKVSNVEVVMRDLGGQSSLRGIWEKYYDEADGVCFVVDSADQDRMPEAQTCLERMLSDQALRSVPFFLVGNKTDLEGSLQQHELEQSMRCPNPHPHSIEVVCLSAITGDGIRSLLPVVVDSIRKYKKNNPGGG